MNIDLSPIDRRKVKNLGEVLEMNNEVLGLMSRYLTVCPDFITKELIEGITGECEITLAEAYTPLGRRCNVGRYYARSSPCRRIV